MNTNKLIRDVLKNTEATDYIGFFGSKKEDAKPNFRYDIYPEYKANRPDTPDFVKKWRPTIIEAFEEWGFVGVDGMEADDAVAIAVEKYRDDYENITVASFDKDLKQIPNITYYYMKEHKQTEISDFDATYNLCYQMLMGDSTDNIKGIPKTGPKTAQKILKYAKTKTQLIGRVLAAYKEYGEKLNKKILSSIGESVQEEVDKAIEDGDPKFIKMSTKRLERYIRIESKKRATRLVDWKEYFRLQQQLLCMLTEAPEWFDIPEPKENPVLEEIAAIKDVEEKMDDFLTV
jgi:5'-3' exonuclease